MIALALRLLVLLWSATLVAFPLSAAAPDDPVKRMRCMACHAGAKQHVLDGRPRQSRSATIDLAIFRDADHGKVHCSECHAKGFDVFPHRGKKTETCMDCHPRTDKGAEADRPYEFERMGREFEETVHFTAYAHGKEKCCGTAVGKPSPAAPPVASGPAADKKTAERFTCEHCHEPHYFKATQRIQDPLLIRANDNGPCLHCHMDGASVALADPVKPSLLAAHAYLPYAAAHLEGTRCIDCHTSVTRTVMHDLPKGKGADQGCNTCHSLDSVLIPRLYRYAAGADTALGFHNARILAHGYVMGANRHKWTDVAAYLLVSIGFSLVLVHSGWRMQARWRRRRAGQEGAEEAPL